MRADRKWLDRLVVHLKPLRELCRLEQWDDTRIRVGSKSREEVKTAVERASVTVLLVSADFLASDFIRTDELPPLLKAAEGNGARILPIIVSACLCSRVQLLSQFQAVNALKRRYAVVAPRNVDQSLRRTKRIWAGSLSAASVQAH